MAAPVQLFTQNVVMVMLERMDQPQELVLSTDLHFVPRYHAEIEIYVKENPHSHAQVTCDGQINLGVVSGDKVQIRKKDKFLRIIHPCKHDHYHILREKLHWGGHS